MMRRIALACSCGLLLATLAVPRPAHAVLTWSTLASFVDPRTTSGNEGAAASVIGGKIYVSHGHRGFDSNLLSSYDIGTDTWSHVSGLLPDAVILRSELASGMVGGKHYAFGGRGGPGFPDLEVFDPVAATWTPKAPMPTARGGLGGATWAGKIYAVGGRTGPGFGDATTLPVNEVYDVSSDTWSTKAPMPLAVSDCYACVAYLGKVYVFGGAIGKVSVVSATQIYNIASNTWSFGASMPTPRGAMMAGIVCDGGTTYIAVSGGFDGFTNLGVTELYNPATDTWSIGPPMPTISSEMAQGITWDISGMYAIGSGMYGPSYPTVFALRTNSSCLVTGLAVSAFEGRTERGRVQLRWQVSDPLPGERLDVLRARGISGPYEVVAAGLTPGSTTRAMSFEDASVEPATRYFYRIAFGGEPGRVVAGPLSVVTPEARLGIAVRPNPTSRLGAQATFTLRERGSVSLELYDLAGKQVRSLFSGDAAAGETLKALDLQGIASGVYFVRLKTAREVRQARLMILN